jgi:hypothetical protein
MVHARKEVEITVRFKRGPGVLEKLLAVLADKGIGVLAQTTYPSRDWVLVLLITDDLRRTQSVLEESAFEYGSDSVVLVDVPGRSSFVAQAGMQLRMAGIGILYSYVSDAQLGRIVAVFKTTDDDRAVRVLQNVIPALWPSPSPMQMEGGSHASAV